MAARMTVAEGGSVRSYGDTRGVSRDFNAASVTEDEMQRLIHMGDVFSLDAIFEGGGVMLSRNPTVDGASLGIV